MWSTKSLVWIAVALLSPLNVQALGNYPYCCDILKCKNITSTCRTLESLIDGRSCSDKCLPIDFSCYPAKTLPRNYTCFEPYFNASRGFNPLSSIICNQAYASDKSPAPSFFTNYSTCISECGGWELSSIKKPGQWAAALTSYILPAVIFSMTIPRWQKWDVPERLMRFHVNHVSDIPGVGLIQHILQLILALFGPAVIVITDMTVWVFTIFILAGPMMVGGIYEAYIDWNLLSLLHDESSAPTPLDEVRVQSQPHVYQRVQAQPDEEEDQRLVMEIADGDPLQAQPHPYEMHGQQQMYGMQAQNRMYEPPDNASSIASPSTTIPRKPVGSGYLSPTGDYRGRDNDSIGEGSSRGRSLSPTVVDGQSRRSGISESPGFYDGAGRVSEPPIQTPGYAGPSRQDPTPVAPDTPPVHILPTPPVDNTARPLSDEQKVELLLAVLAGNLSIDIGSCKANLTAAFQKLDNQDRNLWLKTNQLKLQSMLQSQYSFGSLVGAPVLFYVGSFVYSLAFLAQNLGDNDTAHSLAFGMWWMAIVHVAIISGCLLASNNPSASTAVAADSLARQAPHNDFPSNPDDNVKLPLKRSTDITKPSSPKRHVWLGMTPVYEDSPFLPVSLWDRGRMKREWVESTNAWRSQVWFRRRTELSKLRFSIIPLIAFFLVLVPSLLAGIVSYSTPRVCVSCRYGFNFHLALNQLTSIIDPLLSSYTPPRSVL
jgi:hypothetical protein